MLEARRPEVVRDNLHRAALYGKYRPVKPGKRGVVLHLLDTITTHKAYRNMLLVWLLRDRVNPVDFSANELDGGEVDALWGWLRPDKDEGVWYCSNAAAVVEIALVLSEAIRAFAQEFPSDLIEESPQLYYTVIGMGARLIHAGDGETPNGVMGDRFSDTPVRLPGRQPQSRGYRVEATDEIP